MSKQQAAAGQVKGNTFPRFVHSAHVLPQNTRNIYRKGAVNAIRAIST
jgi:hypothetical protein